MNTVAAIVPDCEAGGRRALAVSVDHAGALAAAAARAVTETVTLDLSSAIGRVVAADPSSRLDLPSFDAAAMDGYAVRSSDCSNEGASRHRVVGEVRAGDHAAVRTFPGEAVRVFTGAAMPAGCDAVLMQERCIAVEGWIEHFGPAGPWRNVRRRAEDIATGEPLARPGDIFTPGRSSLLAAGGHSEVEVFRKIRVGLISTGSELREPGEELAPAQIYNSNRIFLSGMLAASSWIDLIDLGTVPDDPACLHRVVRAAADSCDALLTTGGVSAGEADHVTRVLRETGAQFDVMKVAMRPGKPVKIGRLGDMLVVGLPGNPVAALVALRQFALPALRKMAGLRSTGPVWRTGVADFAYEKRPDRTEFLPVNLGGEDCEGRPLVRLAGNGSSASMVAIGIAEAICILPSEMTFLGRGDRVFFETFQ